MKNKKIIQSSVMILLVVLIAAMALLSGCTTGPSNDGGTTSSSDENRIVVGEGETAFLFTVTFLDGTSKYYTVNTNKTTVGAALLEVDLIAGSESEYGLMVDIVDGVKLDYTADSAYWAFYVDGAYAMSGVDSTDIETGREYAMVATAA